MVERISEADKELGLRARLWRSWGRDGHLSFSRRLQKGLNLLMQLLRARGALRGCDRVGSAPRVSGRMHVTNLGCIVIGDHLNVTSTWVPIELTTGVEGRIEIGDDVLINFGTVIAAASKISIGSGSMIGPHCIVADVDIPESITGPIPVAALPIEIGKDVWLASRVTVRPGVKIGDGAVVVAGSIVESDVPANFTASGVPARALPRLNVAQYTADGAPRPALAVHEGPTVTLRTAGDPQLRGTIISDFTLDDLVYELASAGLFEPVHAQLAPRAPLAQCVTEQPRADLSDFAVLWTTPQGAAPSFARLLRGEPVSERVLNGEVDAFCKLIDWGAANYRCVFIPAWTLPAHVRGSAILDARTGGVRSTLAAMNLRLMKNAELRRNVFVLDANRWQAAVGPGAFNPRGWFLGEMAMARPLIAEAARDIRAALAALGQRQRRLLVLHTDAALWGADQMDPEGASAARVKAYLAFLQGLATLRRRGVLLALLGNITKFEMLKGIRDFPEAIVREADFIECCAGEGDAVAKLTALVARVGVALDGVVYIDARNSAHARVRAALPSVYVPAWPADKLLYASALDALSCFDTGPQQTIERWRSNG